MGRRLIGEAAMSDAERQQRRRDKAKAADQHDIVTVHANGSVPGPDAIAAPPAGKPDTDYPQMLCHPDGRTTIAATQKHHDRLMAAAGHDPARRHWQRPVTSFGVLGTNLSWRLFARCWRKSPTSEIYPVASNPFD
jgi:hypothetical protein